MQITKHIISLFLVVTVLCSGFKMFPPEDINRSGRVGLEDVILSLKAFKNVVKAPQEFIKRVKDIHSTLQINAGLRTIIKKSDNKKAYTANPVYLISTQYILDSIFICSPVYEQYGTFSSNLIPPRTPPPRFV